MNSTPNPTENGYEAELAELRTVIRELSEALDRIEAQIEAERSDKREPVEIDCFVEPEA
jgi:hypothetical protein